MTSDSTSSRPAPLDPKTFWTYFAVLGALATISPFSIDMYLPAFELIARDLATTPERVALSLSSYFVGLAAGQLIYGPLLDRFGRRRPLLLGLALFVVASVACSTATSVDALIGFRFLQAFGGCAAQVASLAMVRDLFAFEDRGRVFSRLMLIVGLSPLFAPALGGLVVVTLGWRPIFWILAGLIGSFWLLTYLVLPESRAPDRSVRLAPGPIFKTFVEIFQHPQFRAYALAGAFSFSSLFVYLAAAPSLFIGFYKMTSMQFSAIFAILSIGMIGGGQFNILLGRKFKANQIMRSAMIVQAVMALLFLGGAGMGILGPDLLGLSVHIAILFIYIACVGLTYPNAAVLALAPFEKNSGSAAALMGTFQMLIGGVVSGLFGLLALGPSLSLAILFGFSAFMGLIFILGLKNRLRYFSRGRGSLEP